MVVRTTIDYFRRPVLAFSCCLHSSFFPTRHTLPLYTSLINIVFSYDPIGYGVPYNYILFADSREPLVECVLQLLCVALEQHPSQSTTDELSNKENLNQTIDELANNSSNLFVNYLSRIHRDEVSHLKENKLFGLWSYSFFFSIRTSNLFSKASRGF